MAKYSTEYKLKVVQEYLAGKGSYEALSKQHKIASRHIKTWVKVYEAFGSKGLERSRAQQTYTFEFKCSAVECYLSTEASYQEVAIALGLNNPTLLARWTKEYRLGGVAERKSAHHAETAKRASARYATRRDRAAAEGSAGREYETAHRECLFR